jgi:hypothetical protein
LKKKITNSRYNIFILLLGVPKELVTKKIKAPDSAFMRNGELLLVRFQDKKAKSEKEIFVIDSKGTAGTSSIERYEKGKLIF